MHNLETVTNLADVCYKIGKQLLLDNNPRPAIVWLERALGFTGDEKKGDPNEMRPVIQNALGIYCLLSHGNA